jgi:predicted HTH domain antitoxin
MSDDQKLAAGQEPKKLPTADEKALKSGDDLALEALSKTSPPSVSTINDDDDDSSDELDKSNQLAETLTSLQNIVERTANEVMKIQEELKEKRGRLKSVFDNDTQLAEAQVKADEFSKELKERKGHMHSDPQVTSLKVQIGELSQQKKELEESLSNHLVNLYSLTNSTSFDTSDGDQWEFKVHAKIKPRKRS